MKKVAFVILTVLAVVSAYIGFYNYLKVGGVKIIKDTGKNISKQSDFYMHYKVLNKKLLDDYGIDLRILIDKEKTSRDSFAQKELERIISRPRKLTPNIEAKKFVFILINPTDKTLILKSSSLTLPSDIFGKVDKSSIESYAISLEEALLDYEWNHKKD